MYFPRRKVNPEKKQLGEQLQLGNFLQESAEEVYYCGVSKRLIVCLCVCVCVLIVCLCVCSVLDQLTKVTQVLSSPPPAAAAASAPPGAVHQRQYTSSRTPEAAVGQQHQWWARPAVEHTALRPDLLASREQSKRWRERAAASCPTSFGGVLHQTPPLSCVAAAAALSEWWNYVVRWKPLPAVLMNIQGLLR